MRDVVQNERGYLQAWVWHHPSRELEVLRSKVVSQEGAMNAPVRDYLGSHCTSILEEEWIDDEEWKWGGYDRELYAELTECPGEAVPHKCCKTMAVKGCG